MAEPNTLQRAVGRSANLKALVQSDAEGWALWQLVHGVCKPFHQPKGVSGPQHGVTGSGTDLGLVAFCTGPSHATSGVVQEPPGQLLPSESPFYFS